MSLTCECTKPMANISTEMKFIGIIQKPIIKLPASPVIIQIPKKDVYLYQCTKCWKLRTTDEFQ